MKIFFLILFGYIKNLKINTAPKLKSDSLLKLEKLNINIFNDKRIKIWKIGKK